MEFADGRAPKCRNSGLAWLEICTPPPPRGTPIKQVISIFVIFIFLGPLKFVLRAIFPRKFDL